MEEKIFLTNLNKDGVTVQTIKVIIEDGVEYRIGEPHSTAFSNSIKDREELKNYLTEQEYFNVVMLMWGDTPTVEENTTS